MSKNPGVGANAGLMNSEGIIWFAINDLPWLYDLPRAL